MIVGMIVKGGLMAGFHEGEVSSHITDKISLGIWSLTSKSQWNPPSADCVSQLSACVDHCQAPRYV